MNIVSSSIKEQIKKEINNLINNPELYKLISSNMLDIQSIKPNKNQENKNQENKNQENKKKKIKIYNYFMHVIKGINTDIIKNFSQIIDFNKFIKESIYESRNNNNHSKIKNPVILNQCVYDILHSIFYIIYIIKIHIGPRNKSCTKNIIIEILKIITFFLIKMDNDLNEFNKKSDEEAVEFVILFPNSF